MSVQLEHPIWAEDGFVIHCCRVVEPQARAGIVEIVWLGNGGEHTIWLDGARADDFMEEYRAAPDASRRTEVLVKFIMQEAIP